MKKMRDHKKLGDAIFVFDLGLGLRRGALRFRLGWEEN